MKITKVDVMALKFGDSLNPSVRHWELCRPIVCRIYTDTGLYGDGEAAMWLMAGAKAAHGMLKDLAEFLTGMDPLDHEVVWNKLYRSSYFAQNGGPVLYAAISALDIALWDMKGKHFGVPVYKLLGGKHREELACYASQFHSGWGTCRRMAHTPAEFAENALQAVAEGFDALKADFLITDGEGNSLTAEQRTGRLAPGLLRLVEERVAAVRQAAGPEVDLIVEGHGYPDAETALQIWQRVEPYDILYFEEPCTSFLPAMKRLRDRGVPVAGGERLYSRWQFTPYMTEQVLRLLQPDVGSCGGISELKKIIDLASVYEVGVQVHCCATPLLVAATLQVEAAMPTFVFHEHTFFQTREDVRALCKEDYQPVKGRFAIPELPGIGNELSEKALAECECYTVS